MDGGRVFRALLAERMKFSDATRLAVIIGKIFGIGMVIVGFLFNFLLVLVGLFVYLGASEEGEQTIISTKLAGVRVRDVMQSEVGRVNPQQTITEALPRYVQKPLPRCLGGEGRSPAGNRHLE